MTDIEINTAIAETCGQKYHRPTEAELKTGSYYQHEPDYCTNLNLMHEAEKILTPEQEEIYVDRLAAAIMSDAYEDDPRYNKSSLSSSDSTYRCSAKQRAEAFLRTVKKWKS